MRTIFGVAFILGLEDSAVLRNLGLLVRGTGEESDVETLEETLIFPRYYKRGLVTWFAPFAMFEPENGRCDERSGSGKSPTACREKLHENFRESRESRRMASRSTKKSGLGDMRGVGIERLQEL